MCVFIHISVIMYLSFYSMCMLVYVCLCVCVHVRKIRDSRVTAKGVGRGRAAKQGLDWI